MKLELESKQITLSELDQSRKQNPRLPALGSSRRGRPRLRPEEDMEEDPAQTVAAAGPATMPLEPAEELAPETEASVMHNHSAIELYLREIGEIKLLTPGEEIALAKRIRRGDRAAAEKMVKANLRLVVKIAHDYEGCGVPLLDLISEGNIGLIKGASRFDPKKGAKFSTYASWWIKQAIKRALSNQSKTIRLPVHVVDKLYHLRRAEERLSDELGRDPTDEELADAVSIDVKHVRMYRLASISPTSLDAPLGEDDSDRIADVVADPHAATPFEQLQSETETQLVREMIQTLNHREKTILELRFGLDGGSKQTLEEVGEQLGVTRERIRQIQEIALKKLRFRIEELDRAKQDARRN